MSTDATANTSVLMRGSATLASMTLLDPSSSSTAAARVAQLAAIEHAMQQGADLLSQISGTACADAARLLADIANAARRYDRATLNELMPRWAAWVREDFLGVPQEVEAHPDRTVRAVCQLFLYGLRQGVEAEKRDPVVFDGLAADLAKLGPERVAAKLGAEVLRSAPESVRSAAADIVFGPMSSEFLRVMTDETARGEVIFERLSMHDRSACRRLATLFSDLKKAIMERDLAALHDCARRMMDNQVGDFAEARAELHAHPDAMLGDEAIKFLNGVARGWMLSLSEQEALVTQGVPPALPETNSVPRFVHFAETRKPLLS